MLFNIMFYVGEVIDFLYVTYFAPLYLLSFVYCLIAKKNNLYMAVTSMSFIAIPVFFLFGRLSFNADSLQAYFLVNVMFILLFSVGGLHFLKKINVNNTVFILLHLVMQLYMSSFR